MRELIENDDVEVVRMHAGAERFSDDDCLRIARMAKAWAEIEGEASWIGRVQDVLNAVLAKA